uniref:Putative secreted protein n=1 Tax=Ixodes ricinus TaxID=34613 RepID=A0A6B0UX74_IXORI
MFLTLINLSHWLVASAALSLNVKLGVNIAREPRWPRHRLNLQCLELKVLRNICKMVGWQNQGLLLLMWSLDYHICCMPSCRVYSVPWHLHCSHQPSLPFTYNYLIGSSVLQATSAYKYIGVHFSKNLSWSVDINGIIFTSSKSLGYLQRTLKLGNWSPT